MSSPHPRGSAITAGAALVLAVVGAWAPGVRSPAPPGLVPAPTATVGIAPAAPLAPGCVPRQTVEEFACPAAAAVLPASVAWPSAEHLFHHPQRRRWQSPVVPQALTDEVSTRA